MRAQPSLKGIATQLAGRLELRHGVCARTDELVELGNVAFRARVLLFETLALEFVGDPLLERFNVLVAIIIFKALIIGSMRRADFFGNLVISKVRRV